MKLNNFSLLLLFSSFLYSAYSSENKEENHSLFKNKYNLLRDEYKKIVVFPVLIGGLIGLGSSSIYSLKKKYLLQILLNMLPILLQLLL